MSTKTHQPKSRQRVYIAVIDVGTTGIKSLIFDVSGNRIGKSYTEYPTIRRSPGQSEQHPQDWWNAACETMRRAIRIAKITGNDIVAVSLATQTGSLTVLDKEGKALHPALTWMDSRESPSQRALAQECLGRTTLRKILWIKDNRPEIFKKAACFASVDTYLYFKLAKILASDYSNAAYNLLDISKLEWSGAIADLCQIELAKLPLVRPAGTIIGEITTKAADKTGLVAGTPVVMGGGDQQCATIGLGANEEGTIKVSIGTWTCIDAQIANPTGNFYDSITGFFNVPHVIDGKWTLETGISSTGAAYKWFRDNFAQEGAAKARREGTNVYKVLDKGAGRTDKGAEGLITFFGKRRGIFYGLSLHHTKNHLARAILEGCGYGIRHKLELMSRLGVTGRELRLDGGGARSSLWRQIVSDIVNTPVVLTEAEEDGPSIGAAILATVGIGIYKRIDEAIGTMVRIRSRTLPSPNSCGVYDELYKKYGSLLKNTDEYIGC